MNLLSVSLFLLFVAEGQAGPGFEKPYPIARRKAIASIETTQETTKRGQQRRHSEIRWPQGYRVARGDLTSAVAFMTASTSAPGSVPSVAVRLALLVG